jgi:hypothetical protein
MSALMTDLWQRLAAYEIGPPDASLTFAARLARENRWSVAHAERVIDEYKRFCWLAVMAGHEVTPSDAVDQAWHLHLTYSRDYWERFCPDVLGVPLHHGPTAGGTAERSRYYDQYARTMQSYEEHFGGPPPVNVWAPAARRFGADPLAFRVNPRDHLVMPRGKLLTLAAIMAMLMLAAGLVLGGM